MELEKNIRIRNYETDLNGNCSLPVIADLFQGAAEEHASELGFGYKDMLSGRNAWVLSRMLIKIDSFPRVDQDIILKTWPKRIHRLFALRDYRLDTETRPLVAATSAWIVINMDTRRPVKPDSALSDFSSYRNMDAIEELPAKIIPPETATLNDRRRVRYTDIDINNHMNNAHYVRWALDIFPENIFKNKKVKSFLINFTSELVFDDEVDLKAAETAPDKWTVWGTIGETMVFASEITWGQHDCQ